MTNVGYARVSTTDQDLAIQIETLRKAGCELVREEKRSGTSRNGRQELETLLTFLRKGDTLKVTRIDHLARSIGDLQDIVRAVKTKGASLKATEQPIDTSTAAGKCFLDMLGVFAEFERAMIRDRVKAGLAAARAKGARCSARGSPGAAQPAGRWSHRVARGGRSAGGPRRAC